MTFYIVLCLILLFYVVQYIIMIILKGHLDCFNTGHTVYMKVSCERLLLYDLKGHLVLHDLLGLVFTFRPS